MEKTRLTGSEFIAKLDARETAGERIAAQGGVTPLYKHRNTDPDNVRNYAVRGDTHTYEVTLLPTYQECTCAAFYYEGATLRFCKHIFAAEAYEALKREPRIYVESLGKFDPYGMSRIGGGTPDERREFGTGLHSHNAKPRTTICEKDADFKVSDIVFVKTPHLVYVGVDGLSGIVRAVHADSGRRSVHVELCDNEVLHFAPYELVGPLKVGDRVEFDGKRISNVDIQGQGVVDYLYTGSHSAYQVRIVPDFIPSQRDATIIMRWQDVRLV